MHYIIAFALTIAFVSPMVYAGMRLHTQIDRGSYRATFFRAGFVTFLGMVMTIMLFIPEARHGAQWLDYLIPFACGASALDDWRKAKKLYAEHQESQSSQGRSSVSTQ